MSISSDIVEIEVSREFLEQQVQKKKDLDLLKEHPLFKKIILESYFKGLASNTVMLKADKNHQSEEQQKDLDNQLMGIASLNQYFNGINAMAVSAEKDLIADAITMDELRAEETE